MNNDNPNWPSFLDTIDDASEKSAAEFYLFSAKLLHTVPPKLFRGLNKEDQQDLIQEIVIHCIKNNFRVLRTYQNKGKPFAAWFYIIVHNKIVDFLRRRGQELPYQVDLADMPEFVSENPGIEALFNVEHSEALEVVRMCLNEIGTKCRLLLKLAAKEFRPREMARILGLSPEQAKNVANDLAHCRKKLANLLWEKGVKIEDYL
jgi:RNA polymerase sigma factor (sigma-70 family)